MNKPLVSVCVVTYNQEPYIERCLNGILMQKTTFPFEILLGEDDSSDGTRAICIDYANKYPDIIGLSLHDRKNVIYIDGRPSGRYNLMHNLEMAKGKYIAFCEGDDFWTDPKKLQKQVDFLEENTQYSMCFHNVYDNVDGIRKLQFSSTIKLEYNTSDFLEKVTLRTLSLVYRNGLIKKFPAWFKSSYMGDWPLVLMLSTFGNAYYINEAMGVYQVNGEGVWSGSKVFFRLKAKYHLYESILSYLPEEFHGAINKRIIELCPGMFKYHFSQRNYIKAFGFASKFSLAPWKYKKSYFAKLLKVYS